jgi:hypothetical protein
MQFIGFLLCIFKDFYCANLNTRVGRIDRPSMNSGTTLRLFIPLRCMNAQGPPSMNSGTTLRRTQGPVLRIANYK